LLKSVLLQDVYAILSNDSFATADDRFFIYPLLLESFDEIAKLRMDQMLATIEMATDNCLLLLDKNTANEPKVQ
jgi:hypothetical protein